MAQLTAVVLAAGKGTRIKAQTPKVLLPMCGRTLVGHVNAAVLAAGATQTVFVVRHERDKVAAHIAAINDDAVIADQDEIKGTGRAAWCGLREIPDAHGNVLVIAGDSPMFTGEALRELVQTHEAGNHVVTVLSTIVDDPSGYGRIVREAANDSEQAGTANATGPIMGIVEHRDANAAQLAIREIATSTYVFDIDFLRESLAGLGTDNSQGEMYLTDVIARAYELGKPVGSYVLADSWQAEGVNDLAQLAVLRAKMNARTMDRWMRSGVRIVSPETTHVDVTVELAPDSVIEPGTILRGSTRVEASGVVGPNSELEDVVVGTGAHVPHTVARGVEIPAGTQTVPFSVLSSTNASGESPRG